MIPSSPKSSFEAHSHAHAGTHDHNQAGAHRDAHNDGTTRGECCSPAVAAPIRHSAQRTAAYGASTAIRILQMDCPTEEALIRSKLDGMPAVEGMEFNLMQRVMTVRHAPDALEPWVPILLLMRY